MTIRERDTMSQEGVALDQVKSTWLHTWQLVHGPRAEYSREPLTNTFAAGSL